MSHGGRNLTLEHLHKIESHLREPLPLLLLRAMSRDSLPEHLRPLYDQAVDLLKTLGESRFPLSAEQSPPAKRKRAAKPVKLAAAQ